MIPNRAQFSIHGMLSLSMSLFMPTNQNVSSYKTRREFAFFRRPKSLTLLLILLSFLRSASLKAKLTIWDAGKKQTFGEL